MEKRSSVRAPASGPVRLHVGQETIEGSILDLGLDGVFVDVPSSGLRENDWLELTIPIPGSAAGAYRLRALVAHRRERGLGLMFGEKDPELLRAIADVLRHHRDGAETRSILPSSASLDPQPE